MRRNFTVTISLAVHTPNALYAAALAHEDCSGPDDLLDDDGQIDVAACLCMLLDPGTLAGCSINSSESSED